MLVDVSIDIAKHHFSKVRIDELFDFIITTTDAEFKDRFLGKKKKISLMKQLPSYVYDIKRILSSQDESTTKPSTKASVGDENVSYYLVCKLRDRIVQRLLLPGINTNLIIRFYI